MPGSFHRLLLLLLLWLLPLASDAQWRRLPGPFAATIKIISITPKGALLIGTDGGGIYRSTDRGEGWSFSSPGTGMTEIGSFLHVPNGPSFAGDPTGGTGLLKSTDDGATWSDVTNYINDGCDGIVMDRKGTIIAGGGQFGLSVSSDTADDWYKNLNFPLDIGLSRFYITSIILDSTGALVVLGSRNKPSLLRSTDGGSTWTEKTLPTYSPFIAMTAPSGSILLGSNYGIYRSTDGGLSWEKRPLGARDSTTAAFAVDHDGALLAGVGRSLLRSTDDGLTWTTLSETVGGTGITALAADRDGTLYAGLDGAGFYRSNDRGVTWQGRNVGINAGKPNAIAVDSKKRIIAGISGAGVFRSSDGGETWSRLDGATPMPEQQSVAVSPGGTLFVSTKGYPSRLYRSTDDGATWQLLADTTWRSNAFWFPDDGTVLAGTDGSGLYRSTDNGSTWSRVYPADNSSIVIKQFDRTSDGTILAIATPNIEKKSVIRSSDGGITWSSMPGTITYNEIIGIGVTSHDVIWVAFDTTPTRSSDGGVTWEPDDPQNYLTNVTMFGLDKSDRVFVRNPPYWGIMYKRDGEVKWKQERAGLQTERFSFFTPDSSGSMLLATGGGGIYQFTGGASSVSTMRDRSALQLTAFPSPTSDRTRIGFALPTAADVRLEIYDIRGSLVATIADEQLAAGEHEVKWDASGVASGLYLVRLRAGDQIATTRVVVER